MPPETLPVETAFSMTDALREARLQKEQLEEEAPEYADAAEWYDLVYLCETIANGTWARALVTFAVATQIRSILEKNQLSIQRNPFAQEDSVCAVTPAVLAGLQAKVEESRLAAYRESDGEYRGVRDINLFRSVVNEGIIDWVIRSSDPSFELRGCAQCGKWYEPQLSNRGRFCGVTCRRRFNNARAAARSELNTFRCAICTANRKLDSFSGLHLVARKQTQGTPLRIGRFNPQGDSLVCLPCVKEKHQVWNRYVSPLVEADRP